MDKIKYIVIKDKHSGWSILNTVSGRIVEGGFFSRQAALNYMWKEYM